MKKICIVSLILLFNLQVKAQKPATPVKSAPQATKEKGRLLFDADRYEFGNLNEKGGKVFHTFEFTNNGHGPVKIIGVTTSCGCTSTDWIRTEILPGGKGFVKAGFDPNGRQGKFDKKLTVISNGEPENQILTINGMVFPSQYNFVDTYKYQYGNLAVKTNNIIFNAIKNSGYDSTEIGFYNMSNKKIYIYRVDAPNNILITKPYDNLMPNTDVKIKVRYYPRLPLEYGPVKQEIKVLTNDDSLPVKIFYINANIVEDFGTPDKKALKRSPKAVFNNTTIDLGQIHLSDYPSANFTITNKGKEDLIIRRVQASCGCLKPELSATVIPKGKTATLKVNYSLTNMAGPDSKTVKVITNDPLHPETTLTVNIDVIP